MDAKRSSIKFWLGLFVFIGIALLVGAIFVIGKQKNMFNPVFGLKANFYNVNGLQVGNKVRFSGINVGTVDQVKILNDSTVLVSMLIRKEIQPFIKKDCEVSIGSEGIIGDKVVNVSQGNGSMEVVTDNFQLKASEPLEIDAIIASVQLTVDNVEAITKDFAEVAHNINKGQGTMARLIRDPNIAKNLSKTIENLKSSSKGLDENMEAAKHNFLLRGYYKRKERKALEKKKAAEDKILEEALKKKEKAALKKQNAKARAKKK